MTRPVDQLTLNGAMTLLSYLQCAHLSPTSIKAAAIAATLCEMLSQLESEFPGITHEYGWEKIVELSELPFAIADREATHVLEGDRIHYRSGESLRGGAKPTGFSRGMYEPLSRLH